MDEHEQKIIDNIEKHGCHIMHIFEEGDLPRFTYSIGIYKKTNMPELIITGLKREVAHWAINEYKSRVAAGEIFEVDKHYSGFLEGFDVTFRDVAKEHYEEHFGWGLWYYGGNTFPVLQLIFPSTSGIWPWDENASDDFKWFQPILSSR